MCFLFTDFFSNFAYETKTKGKKNDRFNRLKSCLAEVRLRSVSRKESERIGRKNQHKDFHLIL